MNCENKIQPFSKVQMLHVNFTFKKRKAGDF